MCCTWLAENTGRNISSRCSHNMVNFGPLTADIDWQVWGTPANFKGFRVLASLLHWRRSMEVNQTLHDVWPSPGMVHYIYIFEGSCPITEFCQVQKFTLRPSLALSYIGTVTARHLRSGRQTNFAALSRGRHLYSAGRPSRWALAHILVLCHFRRGSMLKQNYFRTVDRRRRLGSEIL